MANKINYTGASKVIQRICEAINDIIDNGGGGGGTNNYLALTNKPQINDVELIGNKTSEQLGLPTKISDLINDSDFVVDDSYVHTDNNYTSTEKTKLAGLNNMTSTTATLSSSGWTGNSAPYQYDLGSTYADKKVFVGYNSSSSSSTSQKFKASVDAQITGGNGSILYAWGTKPAVSIPIIIMYE